MQQFLNKKSLQKIKDLNLFFIKKFFFFESISFKFVLFSFFFLIFIDL